MDENNMSLSLPSKAAYQNQVVQQINEKIQNYPAVRWIKTTSYVYCGYTIPYIGRGEG